MIRSLTAIRVADRTVIRFQAGPIDCSKEDFDIRFETITDFDRNICSPRS